MALPDNYTHGIIVNDNGVLKQPTSLFINHNGTIKSPKEAWVNNMGSLVRVWPPRAYLVELVPIANSANYCSVGLPDADSSGVGMGGSVANVGNWNALAGAMVSGSCGYKVFAFRRWDRYNSTYSSANPSRYDTTWTNRNLIRRTTATGTTIGQGHGGLYKNTLATSPFNPSDARNNSPFIVIEPGSKILCVRFYSGKGSADGSKEDGSGPVINFAYFTGNDTYFGSQTVSSYSFGANSSIPDSPLGSSPGQAVAISSGSSIGMVAGNGWTTAKCGVKTAPWGSAPTSESWSPSGSGTSGFNPNTVRTTFYSTGYRKDGCNTNTSYSVAPYTLPALNSTAISLGHVGWKYVRIQANDSSTGCQGDSFANGFGSGRSLGYWGLGVSLFLVFPP